MVGLEPFSRAQYWLNKIVIPKMSFKLLSQPADPRYESILWFMLSLPLYPAIPFKT
jgi:hypothetical protein